MNARGMHVVSSLTPLLLMVFTVCAGQALAQIYQVKDMNTEQIRALDRAKTVVLLPGGILEQHGPYLPSFSDGFQNERLTQELANAIVERPGWQVLVFPLIPLGTDGANIAGGKYAFSGTYAVRFTTLRAVFMDLATDLGEQGFRWVFIVHLHGAPSHNRALHQAGDYFRDSYGGHMVHLTGLMMPPRDARPGASRPLISSEARQEEGLPVHAGMYETSHLLFLRPDLVHPVYTQAPPHTARTVDDLLPIARAEHWPGYFGSPRLASAALGATLWKEFSANVVEGALKILDGLDYRQLKRDDEAQTIPAVAAIDKAALDHGQAMQRKQQEWLRNKGLE